MIPSPAAVSSAPDPHQSFVQYYASIEGIARRTATWNALFAVGYLPTDDELTTILSRMWVIGFQVSEHDQPTSSTRLF